ncbi:hypothetical protein B0I37DRAFT_34031 [Chaetomium sp. MPI-CAGE-AT-0009]|nr:hypothetical protein B0I37DRAFT_34031 [Chaetomium sp. MPI-CAGE-AT-0009]
MGRKGWQFSATLEICRAGMVWRLALADTTNAHCSGTKCSMISLWGCNCRGTGGLARPDLHAQILLRREWELEDCLCPGMCLVLHSLLHSGALHCRRILTLAIPCRCKAWEGKVRNVDQRERVPGSGAGMNTPTKYRLQGLTQPLGVCRDWDFQRRKLRHLSNSQTRNGERG